MVDLQLPAFSTVAICFLLTCLMGIQTAIKVVMRPMPSMMRRRTHGKGS